VSPARLAGIKTVSHKNSATPSPNPELVAAGGSGALGKYVRPNLRFLEGPRLAIPMEDRSVDVVASFSTME
jgi:hypothetical protein